MSFFNNMGNDIDITNVKVSKYISGTPKIDKWKKEKFIPLIDSDAEEMSKHWKEIYKNEMWRVISAGLTEDMIDDECHLDSNLLKLVNMRAHAFRAGWSAISKND